MKNFISVIIVILSIGLCDEVKANATPIECDFGREGNARQSMQAKLYTYQGKQILIIAGAFDADTANNIARAIKNRKYQEVWMCSPGGHVSAGYTIGKALNAAKATVRTPSGFSCISACTIAAMGGYTRIIDKGGKFVIHASSSFSGLDFYSPFPGYIDCRSEEWLCDEIRSIINAPRLGKLACLTQKHFDDSEEDCFFVDGLKNGQDVLLVKSRILVFARNHKWMENLSALVMKKNLQHELSLLKYYHEMLLDGRTSFINHSAYSNIRSNIDLINVYQQGVSKHYKRDVNSDFDSYNETTNADDKIAMWQLILTDSELSLKDQVVSFIRSNNVDLGRAGKAALAIYDAMRVCQIQSSCQLERHTAEALGYHNLYNYNE